MGFSRQEDWSGVPLPSPCYSPWSHKKPLLRWLPTQRFYLCDTQLITFPFIKVGMFSWWKQSASFLMKSLSSTSYMKKTAHLAFLGTVLSRLVMSDSETSWTTAHHALLSMGFSKQEYWSGLPIPSGRDLPDPGIDLIELQVDSLALNHLGSQDS